MNHKERQEFKKLKQEMELSLYSRIIEQLIINMIDYDKLPAKSRLEITILMTKIRGLDNKYIA